MKTLDMDTICAPLPTDLLLCSHEADYLQGLLTQEKGGTQLARSFNVTY